MLSDGEASDDQPMENESGIDSMEEQPHTLHSSDGLTSAAATNPHRAPSADASAGMQEQAAAAPTQPSQPNETAAITELRSSASAAAPVPAAESVPPPAVPRRKRFGDADAVLLESIPTERPPSPPLPLPPVLVSLDSESAAHPSGPRISWTPEMLELLYSCLREQKASVEEMGNEWLYRNIDWAKIHERIAALEPLIDVGKVQNRFYRATKQKHLPADLAERPKPKPVPAAATTPRALPPVASESKEEIEEDADDEKDTSHSRAVAAAAAAAAHAAAFARRRMALLITEAQPSSETPGEDSVASDLHRLSFTVQRSSSIDLESSLAQLSAQLHASDLVFIYCESIITRDCHELLKLIDRHSAAQSDLLLFVVLNQCKNSADFEPRLWLQFTSDRQWLLASAPSLDDDSSSDHREQRMLRSLRAALTEPDLELSQLFARANQRLTEASPEPNSLGLSSNPCVWQTASTIHESLILVPAPPPPEPAGDESKPRAKRARRAPPESDLCCPCKAGCDVEKCPCVKSMQLCRDCKPGIGYCANRNANRVATSDRRVRKQAKPDADYLASLEQKTAAAAADSKPPPAKPSLAAAMIAHVRKTQHMPPKQAPMRVRVTTDSIFIHRALAGLPRPRADDSASLLSIDADAAMHDEPERKDASLPSEPAVPAGRPCRHTCGCMLHGQLLHPRYVRGKVHRTKHEQNAESHPHHTGSTCTFVRASATEPAAVTTSAPAAAASSSAAATKPAPVVDIGLMDDDVQFIADKSSKKRSRDDLEEVVVKGAGSTRARIPGSSHAAVATAVPPVQLSSPANAPITTAAVIPAAIASVSLAPAARLAETSPAAPAPASAAPTAPPAAPPAQAALAASSAASSVPASQSVASAQVKLPPSPAAAVPVPALVPSSPKPAVPAHLDNSARFFGTASAAKPAAPVKGPVPIKRPDPPATAATAESSSATKSPTIATAAAPRGPSAVLPATRPSAPAAAVSTLPPSRPSLTLPPKGDPTHYTVKKKILCPYLARCNFGDTCGYSHDVHTAARLRLPGERDNPAPGPASTGPTPAAVALPIRPPVQAYMPAVPLGAVTFSKGDMKATGRTTTGPLYGESEKQESDVRYAIAAARCRRYRVCVQARIPGLPLLPSSPSVAETLAHAQCVINFLKARGVLLPGQFDVWWTIRPPAGQFIGGMEQLELQLSPLGPFEVDPLTIVQHSGGDLNIRSLFTADDRLLLQQDEQELVEQTKRDQARVREDARLRDRAHDDRRATRAKSRSRSRERDQHRSRPLQIEPRDRPSDHRITGVEHSSATHDPRRPIAAAPSAPVPVSMPIVSRLPLQGGEVAPYHQHQQQSLHAPSPMPIVPPAAFPAHVAPAAAAAAAAAPAMVNTSVSPPINSVILEHGMCLRVWPGPETPSMHVEPLRSVLARQRIFLDGFPIGPQYASLHSDEQRLLDANDVIRVCTGSGWLTDQDRYDINFLLRHRDTARVELQLSSEEKRNRCLAKKAVLERAMPGVIVRAAAEEVMFTAAQPPTFAPQIALQPSPLYAPPQSQPHRAPLAAALSSGFLTPLSGVPAHSSAVALYATYGIAPQDGSVLFDTANVPSTVFHSDGSEMLVNARPEDSAARTDEVRRRQVLLCHLEPAVDWPFKPREAGDAARLNDARKVFAAFSRAYSLPAGSTDLQIRHLLRLEDQRVVLQFASESMLEDLARRDHRLLYELGWAIQRTSGAYLVAPAIVPRAALWGASAHQNTPTAAAAMQQRQVQQPQPLQPMPQHIAPPLHSYAQQQSQPLQQPHMQSHMPPQYGAVVPQQQLQPQQQALNPSQPFVHPSRMLMVPGAPAGAGVAFQPQPPQQHVQQQPPPRFHMWNQA